MESAGKLEVSEMLRKISFIIRSIVCYTHASKYGVRNYTVRPAVKINFRNGDDKLMTIAGTLALLADWLAQLVEHSISSRKVVGSFPGRVIPKTLKMGPVVFSLGAQHK